MLERGGVRLQDAVNVFETSGGHVYTHSTRFLEHLLRHLPLSAFSGARKLGWMLFERTDPFSVLARLLQHIRVLEDRQRTFNAMSKETYHELEQLMKAEERVFSRPEGLRGGAQEHAPAWHTDDPPEHVVSMWAEQDADVVDARNEPRQWAHLEELVQQMKHHISFLNIYGIALRKCTGRTKCKFCTDHPPRGDYITQIPRELLMDACDPPCTEQPCTHTLNIEYSEIMAVLNNLAPDLCVPRKCGYCRHNILGCPEVPPNHPKHKSNRKTKPKKK